MVSQTQTRSAFLGSTVMPPKYQPRFQMRLSLLTRVQASILVPGISLSLVTGPRKDFDSALGRVTYELAVTGQATLRPYLNSDDWRDARFASFDEAFHIIQKDQDDVLKWAERGMKKSFTP